MCDTAGHIGSPGRCNAGPLASAVYIGTFVRGLQPSLRAPLNALQREPIVYCLEGVDNHGAARNVALPPSARLSAEFRADLLGGVTVVTDEALMCLANADTPKPLKFTAVPYYAWDNRAPGTMVVWLPEDPSLAEARPRPTIANQSSVSASHKNGPDGLEAMNDQVEPKASNDHSIPRFTWWDHRGTREWVQYDFQTAARVSTVEVYWNGRPSGPALPGSWPVSRSKGNKGLATPCDRRAGGRSEPWCVAGEADPLDDN